MGKPRAILYARVSTKKQAEDDRYSLPQQLDALREHAARQGYEVPEGFEITDPGYSGATLDRPGMDRVRDLVAAGGISVVLAQDRDRFAREPALLWLLNEQFAPHGTRLVALNAQTDDSAEGELQGGILDQLAKYERTKLIEKSRRGKLQKAKQGKVPARRPPMGFVYGDGEFTVDEARMAYVRRMFCMVGLEGETMGAVTRAFERDGVPTQGGAKRWDATTIRRMINNDVYLPHAPAEIAALLNAGQMSPDVVARLDPEESYGVYWFNRQRVRKVHTGPKRNVRKDNDLSEWIAVPVPNAGIPREWVEGARAAIHDNRRPPDLGRRYYELKSLLFCPCGRRLTTFAARRKYKSKTYFTYHYVCSHQRRHGSGACEHARYHAAEQVEGRVRQLILDLIHRPEVMMEHVREDVEREKERLKNADREKAAWAAELAEIERKRDAYEEMRADRDITKEKFRKKVAELDARKVAAERELETLRVDNRRLEALDSLPGLVEEYIRDLPYLVQGPQRPIRDYVMKDGLRGETLEPHCRELYPHHHTLYRLTPDMFRERTPEEKEELRQAEERKRGLRYRAMYDLLGLKTVVQKDGTLEVSGTFGVRSMELGGEQTSIWKSVTRESAEDLPPPESYLEDEEDRCRDRRVPRRTRSRRSSSRWR